ncbi:glycerol-3-phosphate acyltransferase [Rossellomorea aquimaris]|uniref:glycerol-3-phosphate acyltransferase n=1 Tax=Rossellomorea aquimaris TaxID=189382 RepID=UPI0007D06189|nr:glycerol-3-phosphate acyltransferase [Rossellomorea aquimaris]
MSPITLFFIIVIYSYILGSVTGAYYVVKGLTKRDIRTVGSGNVGATNAGRLLGKTGFLFTLLIDVFKVIISLSFTAFLTNGDEMFLIFSSLFLIIGHLFPFQLRFQGGKGVVVFLTSAFYLSPITLGIFSIIMGILYSLLRRYTLAGFISMFMIPITAYLIEDSIILSLGLFILFMIVALVHKRTRTLTS